MRKVGYIKKDGFVETEDGLIFHLPKRGTDDEGYAEVLIDATSIGLRGSFQRQSIKPLIGKKCEFVTNNNKFGYNFTIIN